MPKRTRKTKQADQDAWAEACGDAHAKVMDVLDTIGEAYGGGSRINILAKCLADAVENSSCEHHRGEVAAQALQRVKEELERHQGKTVAPSKVQPVARDRVLH
jgi:hypothetical protein